MYYSFSLYATSGTCIGEFGTAANIARCRKKEKNVPLNAEIGAERALSAGKDDLGTNVKIGIYRRYKNTIRTLNP